VILNVLKFVLLFMGITYSTTVIGTVVNRQMVSSVQVILMGLGIAGFVFLQWVL